MKIMLIGATGTIGGPVGKRLKESHEVVEVAHSTGPLRVDLADGESIRTLFARVGRVDAVVSAAGAARFGKLEELSDEDFALSLNNKLMGQVNLVRTGCDYLNDNGSFTLTSGVLSQEPMVGSCAISLVNAGLEGFVRAAALELPRGLRVNVVSPIWVSETLQKMGQDPAQGMPAAQVAQAYMEAVTGKGTGRVLDVRDFA